MSQTKRFIAMATLILLEQSAQAGRGKVTRADIQFWGCLNRMAAHRALNELEKLGLVTKEAKPYKNTIIYLWSSTCEGRALELQRKAF